MQFDLSAVETATMVFIGTLVFALVLVGFVLTAGFLALVMVGVGKLAWFLASTTLLTVVHGINHGWDRLVHHASTGATGTSRASHPLALEATRG
ncbi:hypothetical protein AHiyo4_49270 [Arthrobacter sp. Hiyo4]|nr:hypothetical protein AHiyo4_49270 [Arthrobacter sp. Hiyo4]